MLLELDVDEGTGGYKARMTDIFALFRAGCGNGIFRIQTRDSE